MTAMLWELAGGAFQSLLIAAGILIERRLRNRRKPAAPEPPPAGPWTAGPAPADITLTPEQTAHLAALGLRYAGGDMRAGLEMAGFLRSGQPELSPLAIARSVILMRQVACYFHRVAPNGDRALIGLLEAMGGAAVALDLASLERSEEIPS